MSTLKEIDRWLRNHEKSEIRLIGALKCYFYTELSCDSEKKIKFYHEKLDVLSENLKSTTHGRSARIYLSHGSRGFSPKDLMKK
jgi:hypothetical protein